MEKAKKPIKAKMGVDNYTGKYEISERTARVNRYLKKATGEKV
jgi:hypothetical protein